jgi:tRNA pseudouridine13 synthase
MEDVLRPLPMMTAALAGVGGQLKAVPEDFVVEELPAYEPSGEGPHVYLKVRKRDVSSGWLMRQLSKRFGVPEDEIGIAGNKDRCAVTTQWVSLPGHLVRRFDVAALKEPVAEGIEVMEVSRHQNKLRRGHLAGNRFTIRLRELAVSDDEALERAQAICAALEAHGVGNFYGPQRFGQGGSTLVLGFKLARGEREGTGDARKKPFLKKLALNAVQSWLFNEALVSRHQAGTLHTVLAGDIVQKMPAGASFEVSAEEVAKVQARLEAREVALTGPMFGSRTRRPGGEVGAFEAALLAGAGLDTRAVEQLGPGTRRPYLVWPQDLTVKGEPGALVLSFGLPPGSYATVVAREFIKGDVDAQMREEE